MEIPGSDLLGLEYICTVDADSAASGAQRFTPQNRDSTDLRHPCGQGGGVHMV